MRKKCARNIASAPEKGIKGRERRAGMKSKIKETGKKSPMPPFQVQVKKYWMEAGVPRGMTISSFVKWRTGCWKEMG